MASLLTFSRRALAAAGGVLLLSLTASAAEPGRPARADASPRAAILHMAGKSSCAAYSWKHRGWAPRAFIKGMALTFAKAVCEPQRADVKLAAAAADLSPGSKDGFAVYNDIFDALGMRNDLPGLDTLRHTYVLLIGLGMMETTGRYCEGRDVSHCPTTADTGEAGLFQTTYGTRSASRVLGQMFASYAEDQSRCLLDVFKSNVACKLRQSLDPACPEATNEVSGSGPGADWQRLTRTCPAFAVEHAAVVLRKYGGHKGQFYPILKRQAEVRPECDGMLHEVQDYVAAHPEVCRGL